MSNGMNIAFFGSSLVSAYWNGAATYYRGLIRALAERGHRVTFYEPDAFERQQHRDIADPDWAQVVVYSAQDETGPLRALESAREADLLIKASGVGVFDELLEVAILQLKSARNIVAFWDVDAPATLERIQKNPGDPFRRLIPGYDCIFTYGGGAPVVQAYSERPKPVIATQFITLWTRRPIIRLKHLRALRGTWVFWGTACRTGRAGWRNFF